MRTTFDISSAPRARYSGLSRRAFRSAGILILAALLLVALDRIGILHPVKGQAQALLRPIEQTLTQARIAMRTGVESVAGARALREQVTQLEHELRVVREENIRLQTLQAENDQLKLELGIRQTYEWMTVPASVVQANAENGRRMIRIDRGRRDGLERGMAVAAKEGGSPAALIGIIDTLYAQTANVLLITDYGSAVSAHTTEQNRAKGMVLGQWQMGSRIKFVDVEPTMPLAEGDYVVTSGLSRLAASDTPMAQVPANVPIGVVTEVDRTNHEQTAEIQPFVDPDRVRNVWVITGQK